MRSPAEHRRAKAQSRLAVLRALTPAHETALLCGVLVFVLGILIPIRCEEQRALFPVDAGLPQPGENIDDPGCADTDATDPGPGILALASHRAHEVARHQAEVSFLSGAMLNREAMSVRATHLSGAVPHCLHEERSHASHV